MAHTIIIGQTESGKTMLARSLALEYKKAGYNVLVLDSAFNEWEAADYHTDDITDFINVAAASRQCALFIDEAGEEVGTYQRAGNVIATKMRHLGHAAHFIAQRTKAVNATVRQQCSRIALFNVWRDDAKEMAQEFNKPELAKAADLAQFEYFYTSRFGEVIRGNIRDDYTKMGKFVERKK